jgi:hypothetical protein
LMKANRQIFFKDYRRENEAWTVFVPPPRANSRCE